jgi:hypothetical protein
VSVTPLEDFADEPSAGAPPEPAGGTVKHDSRIVTLDEFIGVDEQGAEALLGDAGDALIPENGDVMFYGDGGAGKTTLAVDLGCHLAAGDDWLGIRVGRPLCVLFIENEGPRPLFRAKLRRKRDAWTGSPLEGRLLVWEEPWAELTFADPAWRKRLAVDIARLRLDVVIVGPVTASGMEAAGTLQDVRAFAGLLAETRRLSRRRVTFSLVHHENKGGQVSGAWEGCGDTLLHVQAQGHGRTRLYVQKARWASVYHATTLHLLWADGEGFTLLDEPDRDDNTLADELLEAVRANGGASWNAIEKSTAVHGKGERLREIRDRLLLAGRLRNAGGKAGMKLWHVDDPARPADQGQLCPEGDTLGDTPVSDAGGKGAVASTVSLCPDVVGTQDTGTHLGPPAENERSVSRDGDTLDDEPSVPEHPGRLLLGDAGYAVTIDQAYSAGHITEAELRQLLNLNGLVARARRAREAA